MIGKRILKQFCRDFCSTLPLTIAVTLVVEMRQTASDVIEAESFLKKHFEALPVGLGELPTTALTEPTHIICTSLVSAANNSSSALNLTRPCIIRAHTANLPLHGRYTHLNTRAHTQTHALISDIS